MAVKRIERIHDGSVTGTAHRDTKGKFVCHMVGLNTDRIEFDTLDEVAEYLRSNRTAGLRMAPSWKKFNSAIENV